MRLIIGRPDVNAWIRDVTGRARMIHLEPKDGRVLIGCAPIVPGKPAGLLQDAKAQFAYPKTKRDEVTDYSVKRCKEANRNEWWADMPACPTLYETHRHRGKPVGNDGRLTYLLAVSEDILISEAPVDPTEIKQLASELQGLGLTEQQVEALLWGAGTMYAHKALDLALAMAQKRRQLNLAHSSIASYLSQHFNGDGRRQSALFKIIGFTPPGKGPRGHNSDRPGSRQVRRRDLACE